MKTKRIAILAGAAAALLGAAAARPLAAPAPGTLRVIAPPIQAGGNIPGRFTCDGGNVSPTLVWTAPPEATLSLALVMDDPDAPGGRFTHWMVYDLPPDASGMPENTSRDPALQNGALQGKNDFGNIGYDGPCPPPGKPHRYFFRVYALDAKPKLGPDAGRDSFERALAGHILSQGEFMARYERAKK